MGHIIDLPKKGLGVNTRKDFTPEYKIIEKKDDKTIFTESISIDVSDSSKKLLNSPDSAAKNNPPPATGRKTPAKRGTNLTKAVDDAG